MLYRIRSPILLCSLFILLPNCLLILNLLLSLLYLLTIRNFFESVFLVRETKFLDFFRISNKLPPRLIIPDYVLIVQSKQYLHLFYYPFVFLHIFFVQPNLFDSIKALVNLVPHFKNTSGPALPDFT